MGLTSAAVYIGVSMSGLIGGVAIASLGSHALGLIGSVFIAVGLFMAEWTQHRITRGSPAGWRSRCSLRGSSLINRCLDAIECLASTAAEEDQHDRTCYRLTRPRRSQAGGP